MERENKVPDLKIGCSRKKSDDINPRSTEGTHIPQCKGEEEVSNEKDEDSKIWGYRDGGGRIS